MCSTNTERLQQIRAKCVELLALAEKRTPGKWKIPAHDILAVDSENDDYCIAVADDMIARNGTSAGNAAYIAACPGPAEAGWRATIAAIDHIIRHEFYGGEVESQILAAWEGVA